MTAGHFGLAAGVKAWSPKVPLWALMLATYLLDLVFVLLAGFGVESFTPLDPAHPSYGQVVIQAYYSHALFDAALLAGGAALAAKRSWGPQARLVVGVVVFSHWVLDLIVHRPDLPIVPGHVAGLPLLGFGLWRVPVASALVELVLCLGGAWFYYRALRSATHSGKLAGGRVLWAAGTTFVLLLALLVSDFLGAPLLVSITLMLLLIALCGWLDSRASSTSMSRTSPQALA